MNTEPQLRQEEVALPSCPPQPEAEPPPLPEFIVPAPQMATIPGIETASTPEVIGFQCPACQSDQAIATQNVGEAIDCTACGIAVVSPDPIRQQPAILFQELLEKMGIAPAPAPEPELLGQRQIAEFRLSPEEETEQSLDQEPDPMAWLEQSTTERPPEKATQREQLWPDSGTAAAEFSKLPEEASFSVNRKDVEAAAPQASLAENTAFFKSAPESSSVSKPARVRDRSPLKPAKKKSGTEIPASLHCTSMRRRREEVGAQLFHDAVSAERRSLRQRLRW
ncbi:MAG: hypothetical protein ACI9R3_003551 [Verrucomicrobiales bacterium]|jgi:hypothetical protein